MVAPSPPWAHNSSIVIQYSNFSELQHSDFVYLTLSQSPLKIPAFICASTVHSTGTQTRIHFLLKIHFRNQGKLKDSVIELKTGRSCSNQFSREERGKNKYKKQHFPPLNKMTRLSECTYKMNDDMPYLAQDVSPSQSNVAGL